MQGNIVGALINRIKDKRFFSSTFSPELMQEYKGNADGLVAYYRTNLERVYREGVFRIDEELKSLGIASNRTVAALEQLIDVLRDPAHAKKARLLLDRYTDVSAQSPDKWRQWLDANRERIYFSDVGGYKFRVVPEGYLQTE